ncbi:MAG: phosphoribosylaminoimidazolesuccinocarboxamide synthase [Pseudomonadota bacterium]
MKTSMEYVGKAKTLRPSPDNSGFIMEFRDDLTAFNGEKKLALSGKGLINKKINSLIMQYLETKNIRTHWIKDLDDRSTLVHHLKMFPLECVVRNKAAGSLCKRLGLASGEVLNPTIFEFYLKKDELGDPFINESHIQTFGWATKDQVEQLKTASLKINTILSELFNACGCDLIDFKLEFGLTEDNSIVLADEITPDGCRIWDQKSGDILDKDRFRKDLGDVLESYELIYIRLFKHLSK